MAQEHIKYVIFAFNLSLVIIIRLKIMLSCPTCRKNFNGFAKCRTITNDDNVCPICLDDILIGMQGVFICDIDKHLMHPDCAKKLARAKESQDTMTSNALSSSSSSSSSSRVYISRTRDDITDAANLSFVSELLQQNRERTILSEQVDVSPSEFGGQKGLTRLTRQHKCCICQHKATHWIRLKNTTGAWDASCISFDCRAKYSTKKLNTH